MSVKWSIRDEFRKWQREHPNFMTPTLQKFEVIDNHVVELSRGEGFDYEPLYGVSLLSREGENNFSTYAGYTSGVSSAFRDYKKAEEHFDDIVDAVQKCRPYENEKEEFINCIKRKVVK